MSIGITHFTSFLKKEYSQGYLKDESIEDLLEKNDFRIKLIIEEYVNIIIPIYYHDKQFDFDEKISLLYGQSIRKSKKTYKLADPIIDFDLYIMLNDSYENKY